VELETERSIRTLAAGVPVVFMCFFGCFLRTRSGAMFQPPRWLHPQLTWYQPLHIDTGSGSSRGGIGNREEHQDTDRRYGLWFSCFCLVVFFADSKWCNIFNFSVVSVHTHSLPDISHCISIQGAAAAEVELEAERSIRTLAAGPYEAPFLFVVRFFGGLTLSALS
jgi:hypothetical protein